jgi:hypothetical protein
VARPKGSVVSNLIDIDLQGYEPEEADEPEEAQPELQEVRSAGRTSTPARRAVKLPHPPGPVGMDLPRTRLWIKRPPGPAGLV